jgi:hypothetical protein
VVQIHERLAGQPCCCNQLDGIGLPKLRALFVGKNDCLRDLGLSRTDVQVEASKPFWRA